MGFKRLRLASELLRRAVEPDFLWSYPGWGTG